MDNKKYYMYKIEKIIVISKIVNGAFYHFDKNFKTTGETHNFWEIVYVDKENITCVADNKHIKLNQGEIIFHKPNEYHSFYADGKKAPNVFVLSFECKSEAIDYFANKKISVPKELRHFIFDMANEAKLTFAPDPYAKKMELLEKPTLGGLQTIKNYLELFLINMLRNLTETNKGNQTFLQKNQWENPLVQDIINTINENLYTTINIEEICHNVNYSKAHVCKQFKEYTGKSILQYYNENKIEEAKRMLRQSDNSIQEIAETLGFDNASYFGKSFKRYTKQTPLQYRNNKK